MSDRGRDSGDGDATPPDKKRRITSGDDADEGDCGRRSNHCGDKSENDGPVVYLNVGGANRNVRRSLLRDLRDASGRGDDDDARNPLCDVMLGEHWSDVPTITDPDGTVRIYLDRNPEAFDDLLGYVEYGKLVLEEIISAGGNDGGESARLKRLRLEAGYFTIDRLSNDIDDVVFGEPASFRSGDWVTVAGRPSRNADGEVKGWAWKDFSGNEALASLPNKRLDIHELDVKSAGTYLVFFSLHTVAVTALAPSQGYPGESNDEFCRLGVFHKSMTKSDCGHMMYDLLRLGAFDYRTDQEARRGHPLLFTAACAEPLSLREGDRLYCQHGTGVAHRPGQRIGDLVQERTEFAEDARCVCYITLVRVSGGSPVKWNVRREKGEPTFVKWTPSENDFSKPPGSASLVSGDTKVQFKKAGYYLILGRVASRLKKDCDYEYGERPGVQLELRTKGGTPLHILPEVVTYPSSPDDVEYDKRTVDYGPINDVLYAEEDSRVCVRAVRGACLAGHGTVPVSFDKIPTQSLSAIRLSRSIGVDRYQISLSNYQMRFERALGGDASLLEEQEPLFAVESEGDRDATLKAVSDCQCIVVGSLSSLMGPISTLSKNGTAFIHSQLCENTGRGSHSFNGVVVLEKNDRIQLKSRGMDECYDCTPNCGHLAFVALGS